MADIVTPRDLSNELVSITNDATLFEIYNPDQSRNEKVQMSTLVSYMEASITTLELDTLIVLGETILARDGGSVGIGTSLPGAQLHLNAGTSADQLRIGASSNLYKIGRDSGTGLLSFQGTQAGATGYVFKNYDGSTDLIILDSGNVGIGIAAPQSKLEINGAMSSGQSTIITDTDALDVAGVNSVLCNTINNSITIGGLANGVTGQVVRLIKIHANNNLIIEHGEGSGTQKIITPDQADITLTTYGGVTLVYDGAFWMIVSE